MNTLQKRLAQIGTEPHENGLCDGIVLKTQKPNVIGFSTTIPIANGSSTIWCITPNLAGKKPLRN